MTDFSHRRSLILDSDVSNILKDGGEKAKSNANNVLRKIENAMIGKSFCTN